MTFLSVPASDNVECLYKYVDNAGYDSNQDNKKLQDNKSPGIDGITPKLLKEIAKERCKLDIRKYAFSQRTINEWNRLPGECVNATSVNCSRIT